MLLNFLLMIKKLKLSSTIRKKLSSFDQEMVEIYNFLFGQ
jgi:hypothetical protein